MAALSVRGGAPQRLGSPDLTAAGGRGICWCSRDLAGVRPVMNELHPAL